MTYLLDANVISEARRTAGDTNVLRWFDEVDSADLHTSVLVIGEIRKGIDRLRRRGDDAQATIFDDWLSSVKAGFADRLLPVTLAVAERWGQLDAISPVGIVDGLLAATALEHDLTLVTRDTKALAGTGVRLLDPWAA